MRTFAHILLLAAVQAHGPKYDETELTWWEFNPNTNDETGMEHMDEDSTMGHNMGDPDADVDYPVEKVRIALFDLSEDDYVYEWMAGENYDSWYEPLDRALVALIFMKEMPTGGDIITFGAHVEGHEDGPLAVWKGDGSFYTSWFQDINMLKIGLMGSAPTFIGEGNEDVQTMPEGFEGPDGLGDVFGHEVKEELKMLKIFNYANTGAARPWEYDLYHAHLWIYKSETNQWVTFHDDNVFEMAGAACITATGFALALSFLF